MVQVKEPGKNEDQRTTSEGCQQTGCHVDDTDMFHVRDLPIRTQKYLEFDNLRFEEWVEEMKAIRVGI